MQLGRFRTNGEDQPRVGFVAGTSVRALKPHLLLKDILFHPDPRQAALDAQDPDGLTLPLASIHWLSPLEDQEVWGAGVTYERSKVARQEESETGGTFYDQVYRADRPELFFKATPSRVVGPGQSIRIRQDTAWSVPEPELTLVLSPTLQLVGYTIGNDVSARDIEGRNPLYLPQAKVYEACCALGPVVTLVDELPDQKAIAIHLRIEREGVTVFEAQTSTARMARSFTELIDWLGRDNLFPQGAFLLTGTGIVPPDEFSLRAGDLVTIEVPGIGSLQNSVEQHS